MPTRDDGASVAAGANRLCNDGSVAHCWVLIGLTGAYVVAAGLGIWGAWLAINGIWITVKYRLVDSGDGTTAVDAEESYELPPLRDLWRWRGLREFWRRRAEESRRRRAATDAQIVIGAGVFISAVGNIAALWWV